MNLIILTQAETHAVSVILLRSLLIFSIMWGIIFFIIWVISRGINDKGEVS